MKYIAADLHISSATFAILGHSGKLLDLQTMALSEKLIMEYINSIRGPKQITFEEGPLAQWMVNIVHDKVDQMLVCNPMRNALVYTGASNDDRDACDLAELLYLGKLKEVYHPLERSRQDLRELVNMWIKIQKEKTRAKNRLKAIFRMKGIPAAGDRIYNISNRCEWNEKLQGYPATQIGAELIWEQLDHLLNQESRLRKNIQKAAKQFPEITEFMKIPGVGLITAVTYSAFLFTPFRFNTKSKVVAYCALSLIENDTGKKLDKEEEKKRQRKVLKRLTRVGNKKLKSPLKSAGRCASHRCKGEFREKYLRLRERGLDDSSAVLSVSRGIAVKMWGIWKKIEREREEGKKSSKR